MSLEFNSLATGFKTASYLKQIYKWLSHLEPHFDGVKLKMCTPCDPESPLLGIHLTGPLKQVNKKTYVMILSELLFLILNNWKQPKWLCISKEIEKLIVAYSQSGILHSISMK